jgi:hypothetical protein
MPGNLRQQMAAVQPCGNAGAAHSGFSFSSRADSLIVALTVGIAIALGCLAGSASAQAIDPQALDPQTLDQLSAIGYVAGSDPAEGPSGVTVHAPADVQPGVNLMTSGHGPVALLMDLQGEVLHTWRAELRQIFPEHPKADPNEDPPRNFWRIARLLPNGDLVVVWEMYGLFKLDRNSKILWALPVKAHHDLQITKDGRIHHLEAKRRALPGISEKPAIDDFLVERDADGNELHRLAVSEALEEIDWHDLRAAFWKRSRVRHYGLKRQARFDPFHTNALRILSANEAARLGAPFHTGDALISMAMLDTLAVLDRESGKVRWWQQGPFGMQHQPRITLDGRIVVFNNRYQPEGSTVQIFDPHGHRLVWQYGGSADQPLYSRRSGGVEPLANGNLLIVETDRGRALEVTPKKRIVWEYRSPHRVGKNGDRVAGIYSMQRVPEADLSWLKRRSE